MEMPNKQKGGDRLRELRLQAGKTQLFVELEAELGSGYLQRVEAGKVVQPEKYTLERILKAIGASYDEASEVLELFGYSSPRSLPTRRDIAWARATCQPVFQKIMLPAYLLDCAHRLLAWNRFIPSLFGVTANDPTFKRLVGASIFIAWFNPHVIPGSLLCEPEVFYPQMIHAHRHEMHPFRHEQWYIHLHQKWLQENALFKRYWQETAHNVDYAVAARSLSPLRLSLAQGAQALFHLAIEPLTQDTRFRIVYFIPADAETLHLCSLWTSLQDTRRAPTSPCTPQQ
jgi:transcriptional regulator with XRE-family HTH domain